MGPALKRGCWNTPLGAWTEFTLEGNGQVEIPYISTTWIFFLIFIPHGILLYLLYPTFEESTRPDDVSWI